MDWEVILKMMPGVLAVIGLGWWLSGQFVKVKGDLHLMLDNHEAKDQLRHEANLIRFEKISIDLVKLGLYNGYHVTQKEN